MAFRNRPEENPIVDKLRGVGFFEGFTDAELSRVAELVEEVDAVAGAELTTQGKVGQECYVIVDGTAHVYVGGDKINDLGAGEMVGEMALIDHRPRSATVRAITAMHLLALDAKRFGVLLEEMPKASKRVMADLNERLRQQNLS